MPTLYAGYSDWQARGYLKQAEGLMTLGNVGEAVRIYDMILSLYADTEFSEQAAQAKARIEQ